MSAADQSPAPSRAREHSAPNRADAGAHETIAQLTSRVLGQRRTFDLGPVDIAEICHEANRALQNLLGEPVSPAWTACGYEMRREVVNGVIRAIDGATPEQLHEAWVEARLEEGWRWGPVKEPELYRHPNLVPWAQLPTQQRAKDALFHAIVGALR